MPGEGLAFGPFQLLPAQRLLLEDGRRVALGSRAFEILIALIERAGEIVSQDELIARVWPDTAVEDANLRVHIAAVRKALGDGVAGHRFIVNVPGRGYSFVAELERREETLAAEAAASGPGQARNLPARLTRVIGRAEMVRGIVAQLPERRLLTIAGPGGIGKTTVALAVAEALGATCRDGAIFVDLGLVGEPGRAPGALAAALGLAVPSQDPLSALAAWLAVKQMLIVLDNCEHLVEEAAMLAEALLRRAPGILILATSREPLRAEGEWVQRLPPLGLPPAQPTLSAAEALRFPAVQLFVERASASLGGFTLADDDAPTVAEICRRLDGIALAIEFAAGRLDAFAVRELAALLDDRFRVLTRGRRTALPRHQTLRAALDWSYALLPLAEQLTLRRLSVFNGVFTLAAAAAVAADAAFEEGELESKEIGECVASLVAKSLLVAETGEAEVYYRLLDTTHAYARERLEESGEVGAYARRHAEHYRALFARAAAEWETRPTEEWLAAHHRHIDNLRAALRWCFSPEGDEAVGVALAVAAVPLWLQLSLVDECLDWVRRALAVPEAAPGQERLRMQLHAAVAWAEMFTSAGLETRTTASRAALRLAEQLGDADYQLRVLWALWADRINHGEFREALVLADGFRTLAAASGDADDALVGERITGASLHYLGEQEGARERIERMLGRYVTPIQRSHVVRFQFDQRVTARMMLARVLWLQGLPDRARCEIESNVMHAASINHTLSLCNVLAQAACPVALLSGELAAAERYAAMLRAHTASHALGVWRAYADCFEGELLVRGGARERGLALLRAGVNELQRTGFVQYQTAFLRALALALAAGGETEEANDAVDQALERCRRTGEGWCLAELQRVKGEIVLTGGAEAAAEAWFLRALATARGQKVPAWELRAATSLARLWRDRRQAEARESLAAVVGRFSEGFGTEDLVQARSLLAALGQPVRP